MKEIIQIEISRYLTPDLIQSIKTDLEESNGRKIKNFNFTYDEVEIEVDWSK